LSNREVSTGEVGWITFAGFMMVISGGFAILQGIGLIANSDQFPGSDSIISQNASTWGWIHLLVGVVLLLSGFAVFSGNVLARTVGVIAATVSALGAFGTVQFQPFWNLLIIIVDIAVIWALTSHGRDIEKMRDAGM
jgi:hypothetical protein